MSKPTPRKSRHRHHASSSGPRQVAASDYESDAAQYLENRDTAPPPNTQSSTLSEPLEQLPCPSKMLISTLVGLIGVLAVSAAPLPADADSSQVEAAACAFTCGSVCYQNSHIQSALNKGYSLQQSGDDINNYPHRYNNYEGFDFPTSGPWYEFPIMSDHDVYTGGSPGADRVVFDADGALDLLITHQGASGNNFVACRSG